MNSLKSTAVICVLLGVLYGVYVTLNKPQPGTSSTGAGAMEASPVEISLPPASESAASYSEPVGFQDSTTASAGPPATSPAGTLPPADFPSRSTFQPVGQTAANLPPPPSTMQGVPGQEEDSAFRRSTYGPPSTEVPSATSAGSGAPPLTDPAMETSTSSANSSYIPVDPSANTTSDAANYASTSVDPSTPELTSSPASDVSPETRANLAIYQLKQDFASCETMIQQGRFREALAMLSPHHAKPELPAESREQLLTWLDALAAKVIYSREHLLADSYVTRGKESLFDIADKFQVPWQLLQNINSSVVADPQVLLPSTELKIVPGPFRAEIQTSSNELTLFLGDLYAGRFAFEMGDEPATPGNYQVADKRRDRTYYGKSGQTITGGDPANPYGGWWIDLGREVAIHGSPARQATTKPLGCVSLSSLDAKDVYGILSIGSEVTIRQ